jgi:germination protein M
MIRFRSGRALLLALPLALLLCGGCGDRGDTDPGDQQTEAEHWEGYGSQTVILFFAEGSLNPSWHEELRPIELQEDPVDRIARVLEELLAGPDQVQGRAFPAGVRLEHLFLEEQGGVLTIDFNPVIGELLTRAGATEERLALESLKRTLQVNFPALRSLRILIGGEARETLGGHLDISRPLPLGIPGG